MLAVVRLVGSVVMIEDRIALRGNWIIDEGELDEVSLELGLGESFDLSSSIDPPAFAEAGHTVSVKGSFELNHKRVPESMTISIVSSPPDDPMCCLPRKWKEMGLLGLQGSGSNQIGRFKLLGSMQPSTSKFWCTKQYEAKAPVAINSYQELRVKQIRRLEKKQQRRVEKERERDDEEGDIQIQLSSIATSYGSASSSSSSSSASSLEATAAAMLERCKTLVTLQAQTVSDNMTLRKKIHDMEVREKESQLKLENQLRIFSERLSALESSTSSLSASSVLSSSALSSLKKPLRTPDEEDIQKLQSMIEKLSSEKMIKLCVELKDAKICEIPESGEFEIDPWALSPSQFFRLRKLVRNHLEIVSASSSSLMKKACRREEIKRAALVASSMLSEVPYDEED